MKRKIYDILKGKMLISDDAGKHWTFILCVTALAVAMIASSHSAEKKVHENVRLQKELQSLRSEFVDQRSRMMNMKMESTISQRLEAEGIRNAKVPPKKIIVEKAK